MNHGQDTVSGEVVRELCDTFESLLGTYHSHTDAAGNRYDSLEVLLEDLIERLRVMVPEPRSADDCEIDDDYKDEEEEEEKSNPLSNSLKYLRERVKNDPEFIHTLEDAIEKVEIRLKETN